MRWYLAKYGRNVSQNLVFARAISEDFAHITFWEVYEEAPLTFSSKAEAEFVASSLKNNFEAVSEEDIEGRHTPTGFRYRRRQPT